MLSYASIEVEEVRAALGLLPLSAAPLSVRSVLVKGSIFIFRATEAWFISLGGNPPSSERSHGGGPSLAPPSPSSHPSRLAHDPPRQRGARPPCAAGRSVDAPCSSSSRSPRTASSSDLDS